MGLIRPPGTNPQDRLPGEKVPTEQKTRPAETGRVYDAQSNPTYYSSSIRRGLTLSALGRLTVSTPASIRALIRVVSIDGSSS